jgi:hypothetical protein
LKAKYWIRWQIENIRELLQKVHGVKEGGFYCFKTGGGESIVLDATECHEVGGFREKKSPST